MAHRCSVQQADIFEFLFLKNLASCFPGILFWAGGIPILLQNTVGYTWSKLTTFLGFGFINTKET